MTFEVVEAGRFAPSDPLAPGECAVRTDGRLVFHAADLAAAQIENRAIVLADGELLRLAIRRPRDGEEGIAHVVSVDKARSGKPAERRSILAARAIRRLSLEARKLAGRYPVERKDDLVVVNLLPAEVSTVEAQRVGQRGYAARQAKAAAARGAPRASGRENCGRVGRGGS